MKTIGQFIGLDSKKGEVFEIIVAGFEKDKILQRIWTNFKPQTILVEVTSTNLLKPHDSENKSSICNEFVYYTISKSGKKSKPKRISNLNNLYRTFVFDTKEEAIQHYKFCVNEAIENLKEIRSKISPEKFNKQIKKLEGFIKQI